MGRGPRGQGLTGHSKWLWETKAGADEVRASSLSHELNENTEQCIAASPKVLVALIVV